jgi:hypothetical protein
VLGCLEAFVQPCEASFSATAAVHLWKGVKKAGAQKETEDREKAGLVHLGQLCASMVTSRYERNAKRVAGDSCPPHHRWL